MPPRKNVAPSNAVRQFWCDICSKGYPRQPDYENHLRSYDHNHRQRNLDTNKLMARKEAEGKSDKKRGLDEMRSVPVAGAKRPGGTGPRFTKIGSTVGAADTGRFKKVGVTISDAKKEEEAQKEKEREEEGELAEAMREQDELRKKIEALKEKKRVESGPPVPQAAEALSVQTKMERKDTDVTMGGTGSDQAPKDGKEEKNAKVAGKKVEEEVIDWEEYDPTKPTDCDHANCKGCETGSIWDDDLENFLED